jgi:hypothetical protein
MPIPLTTAVPILLTAAPAIAGAVVILTVALPVPIFVVVPVPVPVPAHVQETCHHWHTNLRDTGDRSVSQRC